MLAELPRGKKSTLFFVFQDYVLYICAPAAFQSHTIFFHMLSMVKCPASSTWQWNTLLHTHTHISCLEPAAVQSCKHIALKQFFLAIYNAMPASFSPTQKYRFPARTHPTIRLKWTVSSLNPSLPFTKNKNDQWNHAGGFSISICAGLSLKMQPRNNWLNCRARCMGSKPPKCRLLHASGILRVRIGKVKALLRKPRHQHLLVNSDKQMANGSQAVPLFEPRWFIHKLIFLKADRGMDL